MVKAIIDKRQTTIDNDTGDVRQDVAGRIEGFGKGLRDHIMKGKNVSVTIGAEVAVGQLPPSHREAGKWAVQIMILPFDEQQDAAEYSDRVLAVIEGVLGAKAFKAQ